MRRGPVVILLGMLCATAAAACGAADPDAGETPRGPAVSTPPPAQTVTSGTSTPTITTPGQPGWGPSADDLARAEDIVGAMTVEQRAGRVIMATLPGVTTPEAATAMINRYHLGGVVLAVQNLESPQQVRALTTGIQTSAAADGSAPILIGVDQEGGTVARIRFGETVEMPAYLTIGQSGSPEVAADVARSSAQELRALGFTVVFAPVADVTIGPADPTIGSRSAGSDPALVSRVVQGSVAGYLDGGVVPVLKHFPGHGSVQADSHVTLPTQTATLEELRARDLVPFADAATAGNPAIMVAHIDVTAVDPGVPASMSPAVMSLLRDDLGFSGLAFTDAQEMGAITDTYGAGEAAVRALAAGVDVILVPASVAAAHDALVAAVADGRLPAERLADAATRVVALALWQERTAPPQPGLDALGTDEHHAASYAASLSGLAVVAGPCWGRLVGDAVQVSGGTETDRARLSAAAAAAGLAVGSGDVVRLLGGSASGTGDVVVSLDVPYGLGSSSAATARIALSGRTPDAFRALVDVLVGRASGGGHLTVDVPNVERTGC